MDVSDTAVQTDDVASQYVARVEKDLADNAEEQERIGQDIKAMQQRLDRLERNRAVLMGVRSALTGQSGEEPAPLTPPARPAKEPNGEQASTGRLPVTGETRESAKALKSKPTLVDLVCSHLSGQSEPRSAGEVSDDIAHSHPDRQIKITVVRATLEALVAQGRVRRSKQGRSVFYSSTNPLKGALTAE